MKLSWLSAFDLMILSALVAGCGGRISPPGVTPPVIPPTTEVIDEVDAVSEIESISEAGEITLVADSPLAPQIAIGDVLLSGVSTIAPDGFLKKVTGIRDEGGQVVLETEQAALTEAIQSCDISASHVVTQSDVDSLWLAEGVTYIPDRDLATELSFGLALVLYDHDGNPNTTTDQIRVEGEIALGAVLQLHVDIRDFEVQAFEFAIEKSQAMRLEASAGYGWDFHEEERTLGTVFLHNYVVLIGPVPVVFQPKIEVKLKCSIDGSVSLRFGYEVEEVTRTGARFNNGGWENINEQSKSAQALPPTFTGAIEARVAAGARSSLKVYGLAGPYIEGLGFLAAEGSISHSQGNDVIHGQLEAGATVDLGFYLQIFSHTFFDFSTEWEIYRTKIWEESWIIDDEEGFVLIPAGSFLMGAPADELGTFSNERPQHTVTLTHPFYLQSTEVTNQKFMEMAQWAYDNNLCRIGPDMSLQTRFFDSGNWYVVIYRLDQCEVTFANGLFVLQDTGHGVNPDHPVKQLTWYGAASYCEWLNLREGLSFTYDHSESPWQPIGTSYYCAEGYRLPTEAEWEYACRAGTETPFNTGGCLDSALEANYSGTMPYAGCPLGPSVQWTVPVGSYPANPWGLYDMHGNIVEWCSDGGRTYSGDVTDPVAPTGSFPYWRGGSFVWDAQVCRSAYRRSNVWPSSYAYGVRPARSAD